MKSGICLIIVVTLLSASMVAQEPEGQRDKYLLLTTPYNQRQLTLYKGQFQLNTGYKFAVQSRSYDSDGKIVYLTNKGTGSVYHYYFADLSYGILDFVEAGVEVNYIRHGMRNESSTYISTSASGTSNVTLNKITEVKGPGDILFFTTLRQPFRFKFIDISVTAGLYLPSSQFKPQQPADKVTNTAVANTYVINSYSRYTNGYGVPVYLLAASLKTSVNKFSFAADLTIRTPRTEGENIRWQATLTDSKFTYANRTYKYLLSNEYSANGEIHYQPVGWFNFYLGCNWLRTKGGWTESYGTKYKNPESSLVTINPGFELQVSPTLTVFEVAGFPVSGKNSYAPFFIYTTVRFSNFLSRK
jgi:hypothetical protein